MSCDAKSRDVVVRLEHVCKIYRLYDHPSARLAELFSKRPRHVAFEALKDISFCAARGDTIGVIGENGSGKSTLLKLIAGVLKPSAGNIACVGRVSAVLELGACFDNAFTGRLNAKLQSAIMGFSSRDIATRLERIEAFAELGEFMDRPIKTYSSGMLARLAFACAAHMDPAILLVDEALAVGDMFFHAKCLDHMRRMIEDCGTTLLLVSHDTTAINQLCTKALYLEKGRIKAWGKALEVTDAYRRDMQLKLSRRVLAGPAAAVATPQAARETPRETASREAAAVLAAPSLTEAVFKASPAWEAISPPGRYGLGRAKFRCVEVVDAQGEPRDAFRFQEPITVRAHVECTSDLDAPHCAILIRNKEGTEISHMYTLDTLPYTFPPMRRGDRMIVQFTFANIFRGDTTYLVYLAINNSHGLERQTVEDQVHMACMFSSVRDLTHPIHYLVWQDFRVTHRSLPAVDDGRTPP